MTEKYRVLLIEDDDLVRFALAEFLRDDGFEVIEAVSGADRRVEDNLGRVDAVVSDVVMPDKEGLAVVLEARAAFPDLPIFVISGGGRVLASDYLRAAREFGATDVFRKPFNEAALSKAIHQSLAA